MRKIYYYNEWTLFGYIRGPNEKISESAICFGGLYAASGDGRVGAFLKMAAQKNKAAEKNIRREKYGT